MAHALHLARVLTKELYRAAKAVAGARGAAKAVPVLKRNLNLKALKRTARRLLKHGYTRSQRGLLLALGADKGELGKLRAAQRKVLKLKGLKQLPIRRPLQVYSKRTVKALRQTALALRYWVTLPEITEQAKLGR